jgi:hypothetical protein
MQSFQHATWPLASTDCFRNHTSYDEQACKSPRRMFIIVRSPVLAPYRTIAATSTAPGTVQQIALRRTLWRTISISLKIPPNGGGSTLRSDASHSPQHRWVYDVCSKENEAMADRSAAAKKAAKTTKRRKAGKKAAKTRKLRSAGKQAAKTQKLSSAGKKAALTRKRRQAGRKAAATRRLKKEQSSSAPPTPQAEAPAVTNSETGDVHQ